LKKFDFIVELKEIMLSFFKKLTKPFDQKQINTWLNIYEDYYEEDYYDERSYDYD